MILSAANSFNLLSIGQPGVGKTIFLLGSYLELLWQAKTDTAPCLKGQPFGFASCSSTGTAKTALDSPEAVPAAALSKLKIDCQDSQTRYQVESLVNSIEQTGEYPSATSQTTRFNFSLKVSPEEFPAALPRQLNRSSSGLETLCYLSWWDRSGSSCQLNNPDWQAAVLSSHGGCAFIEAQRLVNDPGYLQSLEELVNQIVTITALASQHGLNYPLALILTQCDRLERSGANLLQVEKELQPLKERLNETEARYQLFYTAIPIVATEGKAKLNPTGAAAPILWLLSEWQKTGDFQGQTYLGNQIRQSISTGKKLWSPKYSWSPAVQRNMLMLAMANVSLQFIPAVENMIQEEPEDLQWRLSLAQLYQNSGQKQEAETIYDRILAQQDNHFGALVGKALLRSEQGDTQTANRLLARAGEVAPTDDLKAKIKAISQNPLDSTHELPGRHPLEER